MFARTDQNTAQAKQREAGANLKRGGQVWQGEAKEQRRIVLSIHKQMKNLTFTTFARIRYTTSALSSAHRIHTSAPVLANKVSLTTVCRSMLRIINFKP